MSLKRLLTLAIFVELFVLASGLNPVVQAGGWHVNITGRAFDLLGLLVVIIIAATIVMAFAEKANETLLDLAVGIFLVGMLFGDALTMLQHDLWPWLALAAFVLWALPLIKKVLEGVVAVIAALRDLVVDVFTSAQQAITGSDEHAPTALSS